MFYDLRVLRFPLCEQTVLRHLLRLRATPALKFFRRDEAAVLVWFDFVVGFVGLVTSYLRNQEMVSDSGKLCFWPMGVTCGWYTRPPIYVFLLFGLYG